MARCRTRTRSRLSYVRFVGSQQCLTLAQRLSCSLWTITKIKSTKASIPRMTSPTISSLHNLLTKCSSLHHSMISTTRWDSHLCHLRARDTSSPDQYQGKDIRYSTLNSQITTSKARHQTRADSTAGPHRSMEEVKQTILSIPEISSPIVLSTLKNVWATSASHATALQSVLSVLSMENIRDIKSSH